MAKRFWLDDTFEFPCKDCPDRFVKEVDGKIVRCHSTCKKYAEVQKKQVEYNKQVADKVHTERDYHRVRSKRPTYMSKGTQDGGEY